MKYVHNTRVKKEKMLSKRAITRIELGWKIRWQKQGAEHDIILPPSSRIGENNKAWNNEPSNFDT